MANCFWHSGFVHDTTGEADNLDEAMDDQDYKEVVERLASLDNVEDILDEYVPTSVELYENAIVHKEAPQDIHAG